MTQDCKWCTYGQNKISSRLAILCWFHPITSSAQLQKTLWLDSSSDTQLVSEIWTSAARVNKTLLSESDATARKLIFELPCCSWSLLNGFHSDMQPAIAVWINKYAMQLTYSICYNNARSRQSSLFSANSTLAKCPLFITWVRRYYTCLPCYLQASSWCGSVAEWLGRWTCDQ